MAGSYLNDGKPQKWALLIGINEYPKLPDRYHLHGCLNDVTAIEELLTSSQFVFPSANIVKLTSPAADPAHLATRANILAALEGHLTRNHRIRNDDVVVISYSGHGSQIPDDDGDEEDGYDETIVPCDSGDRSIREEVLDISDDEIAILLDRLAQRTQNINLIFDSCHSGTVTRAIMNAENDDALGKERYLPPASYPIAPPVRTTVTRSMGPSDWMPLSKGYVLLAACMAHERAREGKFNFWRRKSYGIMTHYLLEAMKDVEPDTTYFDIWDQLRVNVTKHNRWQNPQLEGAFERKIFGGAASSRKRYVEVSSVTAEGVVIAAGLANGATKGSRFAIFGPGTNVFNHPSLSIGEIDLIEVDAFSSLGRLESGSLQAIQPGYPAIEIEHNYGTQQMPVRVIGNNSQLEELRRQIESSNLLKLAEDEEQPLTTVRLRYPLDDEGNQIISEGKKLFILSAGDGHPLVEPTGLDGKSGHLVRQKLESIASFHNVLAIDNPDPQSRLKNKVKLRLLKVVDNSTSQETLPAERNAGGDLILKVGEKVILEVENDSDQTLHMVILNCDSSWGITPIFPAAGAHDTSVAAKATRRTNWFTVELLEHQKPVKPMQPLAREVLKVIATTEPVEFRTLWQSSVRSGSEKATSLELLLESAMGRRDQPVTRSPIKGSNQKVSEWTTTELMFHITT